MKLSEIPEGTLVWNSQGGLQLVRYRCPLTRMVWMPFWDPVRKQWYEQTEPAGVRNEYTPIEATDWFDSKRFEILSSLLQAEGGKTVVHLIPPQQRPVVPPGPGSLSITTSRPMHRQDDFTDVELTLGDIRHDDKTLELALAATKHGIHVELRNRLGSTSWQTLGERDFSYAEAIALLEKEG